MLEAAPNNQQRPVELSIVSPAHNAGATLAKTLDCIFRSDMQLAFEVIVVDDGSTDDTATICARYHLTRLALTQSRGPAFARNRGVAHAKGRYILFLDADVTFPPDLIGRMLSVLTHNVDVIGVGSLSSPQPLNPGFVSQYLAIQEYQLLTDCLHTDNGNGHLGICTRCGLVRKAALEGAGGFDETFARPSIEDQELSNRLMKTSRFYWDPGLVNSHRFPNSVLSLFRRYHRNTRAMTILLTDSNDKRTGIFDRDALARLGLAFSGVILGLSPWFPLLGLLAFACFCGALLLKRGLFQMFWSHKGPLFCVRAGVLYIATCIPIATGFIAGLSYRRPLGISR